MGLAYWLIAARLWEGLRHITSTTRLKSFAVSPSPAQELPPSNQLPHAGTYICIHLRVKINIEMIITSKLIG